MRNRLRDRAEAWGGMEMDHTNGGVPDASSPTALRMEHIAKRFPGAYPSPGG